MLGAGGAVGGAAPGNAADDRSNEGVPSDEIFFYEDALRQGRSVVLVLAADRSEARTRYWRTPGPRAWMRRGRIGGLDCATPNKNTIGPWGTTSSWTRTCIAPRLLLPCAANAAASRCDEETDCLKSWYPDVWEPFQQGYERSRKYWQQQATGEALRAHAGSPAG